MHGLMYCINCIYNVLTVFITNCICVVKSYIPQQQLCMIASCQCQLHASAQGYRMLTHDQTVMPCWSICLLFCSLYEFLSHLKNGPNWGQWTFPVFIWFYTLTIPSLIITWLDSGLWENDWQLSVTLPTVAHIVSSQLCIPSTVWHCLHCVHFRTVY